MVDAAGAVDEHVPENAGFGQDATEVRRYQTVPGKSKPGGLECALSAERAVHARLPVSPALKDELDCCVCDGGQLFFGQRVSELWLFAGDLGNHLMSDQSGGDAVADQTDVFHKGVERTVKFPGRERVMRSTKRSEWRRTSRAATARAKALVSTNVWPVSTGT